MAWVAVDKDNTELIFQYKPSRMTYTWDYTLYNGEILADDGYIFVPKGTIKKLIGKDLTWEDEPVELK